MLSHAVCLQVQEQVESQREECRKVEAQLQKKEVALTAAQGKIDLLASEIQAKVYRYLPAMKL